MILSDTNIKVFALIREAHTRKYSMLKGTNMQLPYGSQMTWDKIKEGQNKWGGENGKKWWKMNLDENEGPNQARVNILLFTQIVND